VWPADHETAGRVDEDAGVPVHHLGRNDPGDDLFGDVFPESFVRDERAVLRRDDDGVDAHGTAVVVLDRHLGLAVRPEVLEESVPPRARQALH
jgi:hypothetical protein